MTDPIKHQEIRPIPCSLMRLRRGTLLATGAALSTLSGCADSDQRIIAANFTSQFHCPSDLITTDAKGIQSKWLGGVDAMCNVRNLATGETITKLYTFLRVDAASDIAGKITNKYAVTAALGSVLIGGAPKIIYGEERLWATSTQFNHFSSNVSFALVGESSYHLENGQDVSSKIYNYVHTYPSGSLKGEWDVTFINVQGSPFAVKWDLKKEGRYQMINDNAAPSFSITALTEGSTSLRPNEADLNSERM